MPKKLFQYIKVYYSFLIILTIVGFFSRLFVLIRFCIAQIINRVINSFLIKHKVNNNVQVKRSFRICEKNRDNSILQKNKPVVTISDSNENGGDSKLTCSSTELGNESGSRNRGGGRRGHLRKLMKIVRRKKERQKDNTDASESGSGDKCMEGNNNNYNARTKNIGEETISKSNKCAIENREDDTLKGAVNAESECDTCNSATEESASVDLSSDISSDSSAEAAAGAIAAADANWGVDECTGGVGTTDGGTNQYGINEDVYFHNYLSKQKYFAFFSQLSDLICNSKRYLVPVRGASIVGKSDNTSSDVGNHENGNQQNGVSDAFIKGDSCMKEQEKKIPKSILKKSPSQKEGKNFFKGGGSVKHIRFNTQVETYFFEKSPYEDDLYNINNRRRNLYKVLEEYSITNTDIFSYYNMRNNINVVFNDIINSMYIYKEKIIKKL
ncbi:conserved Plasmodium protein, unknown function [Plasmodium ovale wallikeri]|uniref:Uncharacterized protein n=1 Tax=Plasmodium ovale wallikeri TaxID=864142 RepID=A0A1A8YMC3_PLAOA|nr:conserved Plasmodium protein, unknown function [Plasmodium ovale wallikeri]